MSIRNYCASLQRAFLIALATVSVSASPKLDLERITPVPATEPIPTMDFFRPIIFSQPALNPSGSHLAAIVTAAEDKHLLLVYSLKDQTVETIGGIGDKDIYRCDWLGDSRLIFSLSTGKMYGLGMMAADVGSLRKGYPVQQYNSSQLISVPLKDRLHPLVWNRRNMDSDHDEGVVRFTTDVQTGKFVDFYRAESDADLRWQEVMENNDKHIVNHFAQPPMGSGLTYEYAPDKAGELAYSFGAQNGTLAMYRLSENNWTKCPIDLENIDFLGAGNESGQIIALGPRQEGKPRALQLMDSATGQLREVLLQDPLYDFNGWLYRNPATGDVLGAEFEREGPRMVWFNEDYSRLQKILDGFFPGLVVHVYGSDTAQKLFLVGTYSDKQPITYSWVNLEKHVAGLIKKSAPWVDPQRMQAMNIIKFKTRDGRRLDAYLTLPAGASKANPPPLVVLSHGGPWARDEWGFDGEVQFLAYHGYAVLQTNYRGSTGYNWMFPEEDQWNFLKMHDDVTDATKAIMASGLIDKDRVAIMGGSFGGYLAVSGVAHEPALYRCAVTNAGVFDWTLQVQSKKYDQYDNPIYGRLVKKLGDPKKEQAKFAAMSPINFVSQIRVPVFVAGGKDDDTVEIEQSTRLISALKTNKVPYEVYFIGEEGHGMHHLKYEVELYDRIIVFLDKYLKPTRLTAKK